MKYLLFTILLSSLMHCNKSNTPLSKILSGGSDNFRHVIENSDNYEVQILYTRVVENDNGITLESHPYRLDTSTYFYPASTVKMPVAFLALHKINELKASLDPRIDKESNLQIEAKSNPQTEAKKDSTSESGYPTIAHYISKIFAVSDNDAYNRLYEFLGQDYINQTLRDKGIFTNSRIRTRVGVSEFDTRSNRRTNPLYMLDPHGDTIYYQPEEKASIADFTPLQKTSKGKAYFEDETGETIAQPFDMSAKNFVNLYDLEGALMRIIVPNLYGPADRFNLSQADYTYLKEMMRSTPRHHAYLKNHLDTYYDSYGKFFMYGDTKDRIPEHIHIYNKVGYAYGYLTDCAYIHDKQNDIQFFLSATIHVNENQIYNDGQYEYDEIGIPFLAELGRKVYQYELNLINE